jgi:ATP-binding protein involved in chromosome partitioning
LLGRLPLNVQIRENADSGKPSVIAMDDAAESYLQIADVVWQQLQKQPQRQRDDKRIF